MTFADLPPRERWGQQPTRGATGYAYVYICPHCDHLYQRDPEGPNRRAEVRRSSDAEEQDLLTTFRATRSKLPRIWCRYCGLKRGEISLLEEYHSSQNDAFVGISALYERLDGRRIQFDLRPLEHQDDVLLTPIEDTHSVKRLLGWLVSHPLPAVGKIDSHPSHDLVEEVTPIGDLALSACALVPRDGMYTQDYEGLYLLTTHRLWNEPLQLVVAITEEIGSDLTVASVYNRTRSIIPMLLQRHVSGAE